MSLWYYIERKWHKYEEENKGGEKEKMHEIKVVWP